MAISQSDIDALNAALATGEKQVILDGQTITYRSVPDLILARDDLQSKLNSQSRTRRAKRTLMYYAGRGY